MLSCFAILASSSKILIGVGENASFTPRCPPLFVLHVKLGIIYVIFP